MATNPDKKKAKRLRRVFEDGVLVTKECSGCHLDLPVADYAKATRTKDGVQGVCRECSKGYAQKRYDTPEVAKQYAAQRRAAYQESIDERRAEARERYWANPARAAKASRKWLLNSKYGLTMEEYDERLAQQNGQCAICLVDVEKPHVDHDHVTGQVRALLCSPCNTAIGSMRDNASIMRRAAEYVEFWSIAHEESACRTPHS